MVGIGDDQRMDDDTRPDIPSTRPPVDTGAILSLVLGFGFWPAGVVLSVRALRRIRRTRAPGRELAVVGLAAGIVVGLLSVAYLLWWRLVPPWDFGWYAYAPLTDAPIGAGRTFGGVCRSSTGF